MIAAHDLIAAPATAPGGALMLLRLSGEGAIEACDRIFRGPHRLADTPGHTLRYGAIYDAERLLDEVLVSVFRAPNSYTGDDMVEISCHGSQYAAGEILRLLLRHGARTAEPGEFTARAFLAGKLDLSQAEAVADMIAAQSRAAHALAATQLRGGYSHDFALLRDELLHLTALLELELDFSEEEVEFADRTRLRALMEELASRIGGLAASFALGNALKEGVAVAIVGRPNAGKSTLLNRLLNEERAMVSDIPGTTRDLIEECLTLDGVRFRFIDTAGLHDTDDRLERMGIERTYAALDRAQVVLWLTDATASDDDAPLPRLRPDQHLIEAINKCDHPDARTDLPAGRLRISARTGEGVAELLAALRRTVDASAAFAGDTIVSNSRHFEALHAAAAALGRAIDGLDALTADLLSEEIRQVLFHLGSVTGEFTPDDVLQHIFSKFCIGK